MVNCVSYCILAIFTVNLQDPVKAASYILHKNRESLFCCTSQKSTVEISKAEENIEYFVQKRSTLQHKELQFSSYILLEIAALCWKPVSWMETTFYMPVTSFVSQFHLPASYVSSGDSERNWFLKRSPIIRNLKVHHNLDKISLVKPVLN